MEIRIPKELLDYLDSVRGDKSRQAYMVNLLDQELKQEGEKKIISSVLSAKVQSTKK